jgi:MPBQ/MSBQ methyltransferase
MTTATKTTSANKILIDAALLQNILDYYEQAGIDYAAWSPSFNMHFGYGNWGDVFSREKMLNRMSLEVFRRLNVKDSSMRVADFGCGVGATMRLGAALFEKVSFVGLTLVPWQIEKGTQLNCAQRDNPQIEFSLQDYHATTLDSKSLDGVYAIESACYSPAPLRESFFRETYRVLKPNGRLVIADGFRKGSEQAFCSVTRSVYQGICRNWSLPGMMDINETKKMLQRIGYKDIQVEEISWKVAPSVLHVPFVIVSFLLERLFKKKPLSQQSIRNLKGAFQTLLLGLNRKQFGYYFVSATR